MSKKALRNRENFLANSKYHVKAYKAKKTWLFAGLFAMMLGGAAVTANADNTAHADTNSSNQNQIKNTNTQNEQQKSTLFSNGDTQERNANNNVQPSSVSSNVANNNANFNSTKQLSSAQITKQADNLTTRLMTNSMMNYPNSSHNQSDVNSNQGQQNDFNRLNVSSRVKNPKDGLALDKLNQEESRPVNRIRKTNQTSPFTNLTASFSPNWNYFGENLHVNWGNLVFNNYGLKGYDAEDSSNNKWLLLTGQFTGNGGKSIDLPSQYKNVIFGNRDGSKVITVGERTTPHIIISAEERGGTDMGNMFAGNMNLTNLNLSGLNTSYVSDMNDMFKSDANLTSLNLSGCDTSNVYSMNGMFWNDISLTNLNLNGFNTNSVTNMSDMFDGDTNLTSLNLSGLNTNNVNNMGYMFYSDTNLTSLNLSGLNTSSVTYMNHMFQDDMNLSRIKLQNPNVNGGMVTNLLGKNGNCSYTDMWQGTPFQESGFYDRNGNKIHGSTGNNSDVSNDIMNNNGGAGTGDGEYYAKLSNGVSDGNGTVILTSESNGHLIGVVPNSVYEQAEAGIPVKDKSVLQLNGVAPDGKTNDEFNGYNSSNDVASMTDSIIDPQMVKSAIPNSWLANLADATDNHNGSMSVPVKQVSLDNIYKITYTNNGTTVGDTKASDNEAFASDLDKNHLPSSLPNIDNNQYMVDPSAESITPVVQDDNKIKHKGNNNHYYYGRVYSVTIPVVKEAGGYEFNYKNGNNNVDYDDKPVYSTSSTGWSGADIAAAAGPGYHIASGDNALASASNHGTTSNNQRYIVGGSAYYGTLQDYTIPIDKVMSGYKFTYVNIDNTAQHVGSSDYSTTAGYGDDHAPAVNAGYQYVGTIHDTPGTQTRDSQYYKDTNGTEYYGKVTPETVNLVPKSPVYEYKYVDQSGNQVGNAQASNESASNDVTPGLPPAYMTTNGKYTSAAKKFTTSVYASASGTSGHNSYYGDEYLVVDQVEPIANTLDAVDTDETSASNSVSSMSSTTTASSNAAVRPFMNAASNAVSAASTEISNNTEPDQASAHQIIADVRTANGKEAVAASALASGDSANANAASNSAGTASQAAETQLGRVQPNQPGYSDASNAASKAINDSNVAKNDAQNAHNDSQTVSNYAHNASSYAGQENYSSASDFANKAASEVASVDQDNASAESAAVDASNQASLAEAAVDAGSASSAAASMANTSAGKDSTNGQSSASSAINSAEGVISNASQTIHSVVNKANPTQDDFNNASNAAISANSAEAAAGNVLASVDDSNAATDGSNASKAYTSASNDYAVPSGQPGYTSASSAISAASNDAVNASDAARDAATASSNASTAAQNASNAANARHASDAASYAHDAASYAHDADNDAYTASSASSDAKNQLSAASDADSSALTQDSDMANSASSSDSSMISTSAGQGSANSAISAASSIAASALTEINSVKGNAGHNGTDMSNAASAGLNAASTEASAASILASADSSSAATNSTNAANDYTNASNNYAIPEGQTGHDAAANAITAASNDASNAYNASSAAASDEAKASSAARDASNEADNGSAASASSDANLAAGYASSADIDNSNANAAARDAKNQLSVAASAADASDEAKDFNNASADSVADQSMSSTPAGMNSVDVKNAINAAQTAAGTAKTDAQVLNINPTQLATAQDAVGTANSTEAVAASDLASADASSAYNETNDASNDASVISDIASSITSGQPGYSDVNSAAQSATNDLNNAIDDNDDAGDADDQASADASKVSSAVTAHHDADASSYASAVAQDVSNADVDNSKANAADSDAKTQLKNADQALLTNESAYANDASAADQSMSNTPAGQNSANGQSAASSVINSASSVAASASTEVQSVSNNTGRTATDVANASSAVLSADSAEAQADSALASADNSSVAPDATSASNDYASASNSYAIPSGQSGNYSASSAIAAASADASNASVASNNAETDSQGASIAAQDAATDAANGDDAATSSDTAQATSYAKDAEAQRATASNAAQDAQHQLGVAHNVFETSPYFLSENVSSASSATASAVAADSTMSSTSAGKGSASSIVASASAVAADASEFIDEVSQEDPIDVTNASSAVNDAVQANSAEAVAASTVASAASSSASALDQSASTAAQDAQNSADAIPDGDIHDEAENEATSAQNAATDAATASTDASNDSSSASSAASNAAAAAAGSNASSASSYASVANSYAQKAVSDNAKTSSDASVASSASTSASEDYDLTHGQANLAHALYDGNDIASASSEVNALHNSDAAGTISAASSVINSASAAASSDAVTDATDAQTADANANDMAARSAEAVAASAVASEASNSASSVASEASEDYNGSATYDASSTASSMASSMASVASSMSNSVQNDPNATTSARSAASAASANAATASSDATDASKAAQSASDYANDASTDSSSASSYAKSASAEAKNGQVASARSDASNADRKAKQAVADANKAAQYDNHAHDALNAINQFFDTYASNANGDRLVGDLPIKISYGDNNYLNTLNIELSDLLNTKGKNGRNGDNAMYVGDTYDLDNYGSEDNQAGSRGQGTLNKYIQDKFFGGADVKQMDPAHHDGGFTNPAHLFVRFVNRDNVKGEPYDPNNDQLILQANNQDPNDEAYPNSWINLAYVNGHEATDNGNASDDGVDYDIDHINWIMSDPFEYNYKLAVDGSNGLSTNSDGQIVGPNDQPIVPKNSHGNPNGQNGTPNGQNVGPNGQNIPHNQGPAVGPHGPINSNTPNGQNNGEPNGDNGTGINNIGTPETADVVYTNADYDMLNANDHAITDDVDGLTANAGDVVYWTRDGVTPNGIAHRAGEAVSAHDVSENPKMFEAFTEHSNNRNPEDGTYSSGLKNVDSSILDGEGYNTGISVNYLPLEWSNYLNDNYVNGVPKGTAIIFDSAHRNNNDEELNGEDNINGDIPNDDDDAGFTAPAKPSRTGDTVVVVPFRDEIPTNPPAYMHYVVPTNADEIPYAPINSGISPQQEYERGTEDKNGTFVPDSYNHGNLRWTTSAVKINVYKVDNGKPTLASSFTYHPNINAGDYVGRNDLLADTPYNSLNPYSESLLRALRIPSGYHFDTTHGDFMSDQEPFFVVPNGNSTVNYYLDKDAAPAKPNQQRHQSGNLPTPRPNITPDTHFDPNPTPGTPDQTPITPADSNHGQTTPNYGPGTKQDPNHPGNQIGSHVDPNDPDAVKDYNNRKNDPSVLADFHLLVNVQSNDGGNGIGQANVPVYVDVFKNSHGQNKRLNTVYQLSDANIRAAIVNAMTDGSNGYQDYYNQKNDLWNDSIIRQLDNGQLNYDNKSLPIYYEITKDTDNKYHVIRVNSKGQALNEGYQNADAGNYVFRPSEAIFDYTGHGHYRHTNDGNVETINYTVPYLKSVRAEGYLGMKLDPHNFDFLRWGFDDDGKAPEGWTLDKIQNMKSLTLTGDDAQNYHRGHNQSGSLIEEDYNNGLVPVSYEYGKFYNGNTDINKNAKNGDDGSNEQQAAQQHRDANPKDKNTVDNVHDYINGIRDIRQKPSESKNFSGIVLGGNSMSADSAIDRIQKASHILSASRTNATTTLNFFNPKSGMTVDRKTVNGAAGASLPSLKLLKNIPTDYHLAPGFNRGADLKFGADRPVNVPVVPDRQDH